MAQRYGFRSDEYTAVWDGLVFNPTLDPHELAITIKDGRHIVITISEITLGNPWRALRDIEGAFRELRGRGQVRGE